MAQKSRTNDVVAVLPHGRIMAMGKDVSTLSSGDQNVVVYFPDLKEVEYLLNVSLSTNPQTDVQDVPGQASINGNAVGITIFGITAGTTLTTEMIAIGPA